jgi:ATP-binding cassette subfamily G (WHITE) protein 2 (PDR)
VTMGVVSGEMLVDGRPRDQSFQRKTGYVQQQDLHLHTTTVREALRFSALLRQPAHVPRQEKIDYVEEVIKLLGMESYADAVVGVPGEGVSSTYCFCNVADTNQVSMSNNGSVLQLEWN